MIFLFSSLKFVEEPTDNDEVFLFFADDNADGTYTVARDLVVFVIGVDDDAAAAAAVVVVVAVIGVKKGGAFGFLLGYAVTFFLIHSFVLVVV